MQEKDFLIGTRFGKLLVIRSAPSGSRGKSRWICKCDCGNEYEVYGQNLKRGTDSCGCGTKAKKHAAVKTHRMAGTATYMSWQHMKQRCLNPKNDRWESYGGRGITVQESWLDFENFYADMGTRPEGTSLERINNDLGYTKDNCRWATHFEQLNNTRANNVITYKGISKTVACWCRELGIGYETLSTRIARGWSVDRALETPTNATLIDITLDGETKKLHLWAKDLGIPTGTLRSRWRRGWSARRMLTIPVNHKQVDLE